MEPGDREQRRKERGERRGRSGGSRIGSGRGRTGRMRSPRKCPECGAEAPPGARECAECGATLRRPRPKKGGCLKKLILLVILLAVLAGGLAAVVFLAPHLLPERVRDTLKSLGVPIKMPAEAEEEKEEEEPAESEESAEPAPEETDETGARPAKAAPVASTSAEESEGPSARESIPRIGNFGIQTRPDLSGGGPAAPSISTGDEIK